jgi:hypothetical protein
MANYSSRPCRCGSGKTHYPLIDAAGIFCTYVCESCEAEKRKGYNPAIFESGAYAAGGEESDLEADDYRNE